MNRRHCLAALAAAAASPLLASCGRDDTGAAPQAARKLGIQLYTLRDQMENGVEATLQRVADIGYREVEFAGYYDHSPAEIVSFLENSGLAAPSSHIGMNAIREQPEQSVETAAAIGHDYLVLSSLPRDERSALDDYRRNADEMSAFAERCEANGLKFGYHNHAFEFETIDGTVPYDILLERTNPDLVQLELDLYWIVKGGADPLAYFRQYPGRFPLYHVKDMAEDGEMTDVGAGNIDFAEIFAANAQSGVQHLVVEHDRPSDSLASARASYDYLAKMTY